MPATVPATVSPGARPMLLAIQLLLGLATLLAVLSSAAPRPDGPRTPLEAQRRLGTRVRRL